MHYTGEGCDGTMAAARQSFQSGSREAGLEKCREIVKRYFASSYYRYAKQALGEKQSRR